MTEASQRDCEHCGASQSDRPAIFRNERWCSDQCRKALVGDD